MQLVQFKTAHLDQRSESFFNGHWAWHDNDVNDADTASF